jgi:hypothetical protein
VPKPTAEQLTRINQFAQVPRTSDNTYVFTSMMIDDQPTAYFSKLQTPLLNKFVQDTNRGVGLLMNHNSRSLPVGRSYGAYGKSEMIANGNLVNSVYGDFYIDLGRKTESGMSNDDIAAGIDAGTIFDTSIGFNADQWQCSICNYDIRDYMNCDHFPGETYQVKSPDDVYHQEMCYVLVGGNAQGELIENSLVYAGAADRATIVKSNFSRESVSEIEKGSTLHRVEAIKDIPMDTTIYSYYSKDGVTLFTETDERTGGVAHLKKRSESQVELQKFLDVLAQFNIKAKDEDELKTVLAAAVDKSALEAELAQAKTDVESAQSELANKAVDLEAVNGELAARDVTISELEKANEQLTAKAGMAETYRKDLIDEAITFGVKVMGNKFNTDLFTKFLGTLSIDEIKEQREAFKEQFNTAYSGVRTAETQKPLEDRFTQQTEEDFETDIEFRNHVAAEALKYSKENGVSIVEATKFMFKKLTTKEAE